MKQKLFSIMIYLITVQLIVLLLNNNNSLSLLPVVNSITVCPSNQFYYKDVCYSDCTLSVYLNQNGGVNVDNIQALYIKTQGSQTCVDQCSTECNKCLKYADYCTQCKQPISGSIIIYLLQSKGKCFSQYCPPYYYENISSANCLACSSLSTMNCKNCSTNYDCVQNGGTLISCSINNLIICKQCDTGFYSLTNTTNNNYLQCMTTIPDGYIVINQDLAPCIGECLTCLSTVQTCLSCKSNNLYNSVCMPLCPNSHYSKQTITMFNTQQLPTLICQRCELQCNTCQNETFCLSCLSGYYLIELQGKCILPSECPQRTYPNTTQAKCSSCVGLCIRCYNYNQCKQCISSYNLIQRQCVKPCPDKTYNTTIDNTLSIGGKLSICQACVSPCQTCIDADNKCTKCLTSLNLFFYSDTNQCLGSCPIGYRPDLAYTECQLCSKQCTKCDQLQCYQCAQLLNGTKYYLLNGQCIQTCPLAYFKFQYVNSTTLITQRQCIKCNSKCAQCQSLSSCTICVTPYLFYLVNNSCLQTCPDTSPVQLLISLASLNLYQCVQCSDTLCVNCTKNDYCTLCIDYSSQLNQTVVLWYGKCITTCPQGYQKTTSESDNLTTCQKIIIPIKNITNSTSITPTTIISSTQPKGIILSFIYPYTGSYAAAGILIITIIIFSTLSLCKSNRGIFLPFLSGLLSLPEIFVITVSYYYHVSYNFYTFFDHQKFTLQFYLFSASILFWSILSLINFGIFCKIFQNDISFQQWRNHNSICSKMLFIFVHIIAIINYHTLNIFWSKFSIFPILSSVQKLKPFTIICGIGLLSTMGLITSYILLIPKQPQIKNIYYDAIAVLCFSSLVNLLSLRRPNDLFTFRMNDVEVIPDSDSFDNRNKQKFDIHKRVYLSDNFYVNKMKETGQLQEKCGFYPEYSRYNKLVMRQNSENSSHSQRSLNSSSILTTTRRLNISNNSSKQQQMQNMSEQINNNNRQQELLIYQRSIIDSMNELIIIPIVNNNDDDQNINQISLCMQNDDKNILPFKHQKQLLFQGITREIPLHHRSLSNIYHHSNSRSQILTDETSNNNDDLNRAISCVDQGSQKAQLGSGDDNSECYGMNYLNSQDNDIINNDEQQMEKNQIVDNKNSFRDKYQQQQISLKQQEKPQQRSQNLMMIYHQAQDTIKYNQLNQRLIDQPLSLFDQQIQQFRQLQQKSQQEQQDNYSQQVQINRVVQNNEFDNNNKDIMIQDNSISQFQDLSQIQQLRQQKQLAQSSNKQLNNSAQVNQKKQQYNQSNHQQTQRNISKQQSLCCQPDQSVDQQSIRIYKSSLSYNQYRESSYYNSIQQQQQRQIQVQVQQQEKNHKIIQQLHENIFNDDRDSQQNHNIVISQQKYQHYITNLQYNNQSLDNNSSFSSDYQQDHQTIINQNQIVQTALNQCQSQSQNQNKINNKSKSQQIKKKIFSQQQEKQCDDNNIQKQVEQIRRQTLQVKRKLERYNKRDKVKGGIEKQKQYEQQNNQQLNEQELMITPLTQIVGLNIQQQQQRKQLFINNSLSGQDKNQSQQQKNIIKLSEQQQFSIIDQFNQSMFYNNKNQSNSNKNNHITSQDKNKRYIIHNLFQNYQQLNIQQDQNYQNQIYNQNQQQNKEFNNNNNDKDRRQLNQQPLMKEKQVYLELSTNHIKQQLISKYKIREKINSKQKTTHLVKPQILIMNDERFKDLKRKLKKIQKQQSKKAKLLRKIEQGRDNLITIANKSKQKQQQKYRQNESSLNRKFIFIGDGAQVKTIQNQIRQKQIRNKSNMKLQSQLHVDKIYKNQPVAIQNRTNSREKRADSKQKGTNQKEKHLNSREKHKSQEKYNKN